MTGAMKRLLRDLCGASDGAFAVPPKEKIMLLSKADEAAAATLEALHIVRIGEDDRGARCAFPAYRLAPQAPPAKVEKA